MLGDSIEKSKPERLGDDNYQFWSFQMRMYLESKDLWETVVEDAPKHPGEAPVKPDQKYNQDLKNFDDWQKKSRKAMNAIAMNVDRSNANLIYTMKEGKEAWETLRERHMAATLGNKMRAKKKLSNLKFTNGQSMHAHFNALTEIFNQLSDMGDAVAEDEKIVVMLNSIEPEYQAVSTAILGWATERLTVHEVRQHVIEEYEKKKASGETAEAYATKWKPKSELECFKCGKKGHFKRDCPEKKKFYGDLREKLNSNKVAMNAEDYVECVFLSELKKKNWIVDSGATCHMTWEKKCFANLLKYDGKVKVANGEEIDIAGIGTVKLNVKTAKKEIKTLMLKDVLWVPRLGESLLSVRKLVHEGNAIKFDKNKVYLKKGEIEEEIGDMKENQYQLKEVEAGMKAEATNEVEEKCVHDWHKILSHRNLKSIKEMEKFGMKIKKCDCCDDCEPCLIGKMAKMKFPKQATETEGIMDVMVSDLCGPMQVESLNGKRYFVTYIDVHSKYCDVKFLRNKSDVANETINQIEEMKTQQGKKPKVFRSDRGGEYLNEKLQTYLKKEGIKFQCTVGYCPQQNGIAERKNRTLMEAARTMLNDAKLSKTFWAEAIKTANHTTNRFVVKKTEKTPYEIMFGKQSSWDELIEFGKEAFVMIPMEKRKKLDDKASKMKFVGYDENSKGYRMTDGRKVIVSREVHFLQAREIKENDNDLKEIIMEELIIEGSDEEKLDEGNDDENSDEENNDTNETIQEIIENDQVEGEIHQQNNEILEEISEEEFESANESEAEEFEEETESQPRRSGRTNQGVHPIRYGFHSINQEESFNVDIKINDPQSYDEAIKSEQADEWEVAMKEELEAMKVNGTWELTELPPHKTAIGSKWVFKTKKDAENGKVKRKARLVAKGFSQRHGIDYLDVFAPVARGVTMRMLLSMAGKMKWLVKQYDVKTAFLNGTLDEEIYMKLPKGTESSGKVCKLKKSLYGLKQAARVWNKMIHGTLIKNGFEQNETDKCLYSLKSGGEVIHLLIHVDDILAATSKENLLDNVMKEVGKDFEIKCIGEAKEYLGIELDKNEEGNYSISQPSFIDSIISKAGLVDAKTSRYPLDTGYYKLTGKELETNEEYRTLIGMLLYLTTNSRPDIAASVSILSQKVTKPTDTDMNEIKRLIRYLKETRNLKLKMSTKEADEEITMYSDSDWGEDRKDRKSNSGWIMQLNGGTIGWSCRKQAIVALSSAEAEYIALTEAAKEIMWIKSVIKQFMKENNTTQRIFTDSQSAMSMISNQGFSNRTKHIDIRYHFIKDLVEKKIIELKYVPTNINLADMMTKPLGTNKIRQLRELAGLDNGQKDEKL